VYWVYKRLREVIKIVIIWGIVKFLFVISFLVLIHEGGHFLTAKAVGMQVDEFAIGFGPKIWSKKGKETLYSIRCLPLGGFVSLEGESGKSDNPRAFANKPVWAKLLVVAMGAIVNIVFALVAIFFIVVSQGSFSTTTVDTIVEGSAGQKAGIIAGDKIYAIDGKRMHVKDDITEYLRTQKGDEVRITVLRNGEKIDFNLVPDQEKYGYTGIEFVEDGESYTNEISYLSVDSPAVLAGLQEHDKIIGINNIDTTDPVEISMIAYENADVELPIKIDRNGEILELKITPVCPDILIRYVIGFISAETTNTSELVYCGFWQSLSQMRSMLNQIIELFTGQISAKYLSGPIGIAKVVTNTSGWYELLTLAVLISMNLGIVNLLPIPPLDGGKIVFLLIEAITRKPVSEKVEYSFQLAGFTLFMLLTLFVTFNDITRNLSIF